MDEKSLKRFWSKVDKTSSPYGCWLWTASTTPSGYGQFWYKETICRANRISWEIHKGMIPDGLHVHHNCPGGDNPVCVNPDHLWLGTDQDNNTDKVNKGRQMKGANHHNAKLTEEDVEIIRHLYENKHRFECTAYTIADLFGIKESQVSRIVNNKCWHSSK